MEGLVILAVFALFTNSSVAATSPSITTVVTENTHTSRDDRTTELFLLLNLLDSFYVPQCLGVVISDHDDFEVGRLSAGTNASDNSSLKYPNLQKGFHFIDGTKPKVNLVVSHHTDDQVRKAITHINKSAMEMNAFACVSYMLPRPPNAYLLSLLLDRTYNVRLKHYFLVYTHNSREAKRFLIDPLLKNIENVAALIQEESQSKSYWRVLIRQLLHPSGSPQILTVNRWSRDTGLTSTENIFPEQMANFYRAKLVGVTMKYIPFTDYKTTEESLVVELTTCVDIFFLDVIAKKLNFTYEIVMPADGQWGFLNEDGHFNGVVGEVEFGRADFALDMNSNTQRFKLVDFTDYYSFDALTFLTAKSRPDPLWRKLITPFKTSVWVCVAVSVGVGSLLYSILQKSQALFSTWPSSSSSSSSSSAFMQVFASFLCQSLARYLQLSASRVFLGFWFLFGLLVTSHYSTALTSTLAVPFAPPTIDSLDQLLQSGLKLGQKGVKGNVYQFFESTDVPVYRRMFEQFEYHETSEMIQLVGEGEHALVNQRIHMSMLAAMYNTNPKRKTDLHVATEALTNTGMIALIPKGAPHLRPFNSVIRRLLESGIYNKWFQDVLPHFIELSLKDAGGGGDPEETTNTDLDTNKQVVLSLSHLQGPFFLLFFGTGAGILVLLMELLFNYR